MDNETELIQNIIGGNLRSFEVLVKQYEKLVFAILSRLVSASDAEDVSQDVFIKVYRNLSSFKFQSKLSTWIAKITYLTAVNHLKKISKYAINYSETDLENFHFTKDNPETITVNKDFTHYINSLIQELPIPYKTVITLFHLNEFTYKEIEDVTDYPEGTVKGYLFRARKILKEKLLEYSKI